MPETAAGVALVTGAANGIGLAIARQLCDAYYVMFADLDGQRAAEMIEKHDLGDRASSVTADVADTESVGDMIDHTVHEFG